MAGSGKRANRFRPLTQERKIANQLVFPLQVAIIILVSKHQYSLLPLSTTENAVA
jgi:hypothetical protein